MAVLIDSYHDRRTAYEFSVNPAGVKQDKYYFNDGDEDQGWDAVWDVVVAKRPDGWSAEFRIPLSQLRFPVSEKPTFGFALSRQIARLNETSTWPLIAKSTTGIVSQFGELRGLELAASPKRLELVPYTVADVSTEPDSDSPLVKGVDPGASVGLDMKYAITPALTLTATVNPDFGQVEADPAVVNLSAFETFFPERRPFFVEGSGVFRFDMDCNDGSCTGLFYTRRIGRSPQLDPEAPGDGFVSAPTNTTIIGATKVTGRIGGFSVGVLNAMTAEEEAHLAVGAARSGTPIEPFTSYTVGRARREFSNQSAVGVMMTATNRNVGDEASPMRLLANSAYSGGVDWDLRLPRNRYAVAGYFAASRINGTEAAIARLQENNVHSFQRPDATHVEFDPTRTDLTGQSGFLALRKISGERVRFESNIGFKSPGFDSNDLGFIRRADQISQSNWLQWRHDEPGKIHSQLPLQPQSVELAEFRRRSPGSGRQRQRALELQEQLVRPAWASTREVRQLRRPRHSRRARRQLRQQLELLELRQHRRSQASGVRRLLERRLVRVRSALRRGESRRDLPPGIVDCHQRRLPHQPLRSRCAVGDQRGVRQQPDALRVRAPRSADRGVDDARELHDVADTLSADLRRAIRFGRRLHGYKELVNGRADDWQSRYAPYAYGGNADFNYRSFRTTNVLRWEYRPGSSLFVVWQQGREENAPYGTFRFGRDFSGVFSVPSSNVFLVKMSYWLNY